ncbi:DUF6297 family protein [Cellulosimicrobium arenosum]|uniref:Uncharacterized protein n=1 Tax=Cellulosimicrobium arenosum TaxID=2708133 RepID=A0A927G9L7_9MICO|nr:DUF6297 family protein [Cellulosimicrobium arenosum]MBD8079263.1 hypothetical protein [Cellulosimicrobium arenosum]
MTSTAAPDVGTDADEQLTGRELRRLTARVATWHARRAGHGAGRLVTDVAYVVVSVVLAALLVGGTVTAVGGALTSEQAWTLGAVLGGDPDPWTGGARPLSPGLVLLLVLCVLLGLVASTAARLGPAGVGTAGVHWWLPTPADRHGLLVVSIGRATGGGVVAGAVGGAAAGLLAAAGPTGVLTGALVGAPAAVAVVALTGLAQHRGSRAAVVVGDALVACVPVLGLALVATGWHLPVPAPSPTVTALVVALAVLAVVLVVVWWTRVDRLRLPVLAARSSGSDRLGAALLSVDPRDLGRALDAGAHPRRPLHGRTFRAVRGPRGALVAADAVLLVRTSSSWTQLLGVVALLVLAHQVPVLAAGPGLALVVALAGMRAAGLGAGGARHAEMVPALDASLPLSARAVRAVRLVVPAATGALALVAGIVPVALATGSAGWLVLAALGGVGCGASAVRGALRPEPDWSGPLLATPMGALPVNAAAVARQGPDLLLLSLLPFTIAALLGAVTPVLVVVQALAAAAAVAIATRVPRRG